MTVPERHNKTFEELRHTDEDGNEFWSARELYPVLGYSRWEKFNDLVKKAQIACETSLAKVSDHFHLEVKMIALAKGAHREIEDFRLSRYACYLIVQNGDPAKPVRNYRRTWRNASGRFALSAQRNSANGKRAAKKFEKSGPFAGEIMGIAL